MPKYYPVFMNLKDRKCVVIGAGNEGAGKVGRLVEAEADVVVIAPEAKEPVPRLADEGRITWLRREYRPGDLEGAFIAIAAATPAQDNELNQAIAREAEERNIPTVVVDVTRLCSFISPSIVERGAVTIATSTGGTSPALARKMRQELASSNVIEYADLAPVLSRARAELKSRGLYVNPDHWQASITEDVMDYVRRGDDGSALATLMANLLDGDGCGCSHPGCKMWDDETLSSRYSGRKTPAASG